MTLLTRCPACSTLYKVVPDQLRISQGWVKCGQCAEVFDATQHLLEAQLEPEPRAPSEATEPSVPIHPQGAATHEPLSTRAAVEVSEQARPGQPGADAALAPFGTPPVPQRPSASGADGSGPDGQDGVQGSDDDPVIELDLGPLPSAPPGPRGPLLADAPQFVPEPEPQRQEPVLAAADRSAPASGDAALPLGPKPMAPQAPLVQEPAPHASDPPEASPATAWASAESAPAVQTGPAARTDRGSEAPVAPTFMRPAKVSSPGRGVGLHLAAYGLAVLACAGLLAQWVHHDHDRLAATYPSSGPLLAAACRWLGCTLEPVRRLDALVLEEASFGKLASGPYRLSFTLRNTAALELARPSIELTLTDANEQPILRRVFSPEDLGAESPSLGALGTWPVTRQVRLSAAELSASVAGYRLLAFYP